MINYNVCHISERYNFTVKGVSYIGAPKPYTIMFISKKIEKLLSNLSDISNCLVFAEKNISVDDKIQEQNCFVFSDNPQRDYARLVNNLYFQWFITEKKRKYTFTKEGYYKGENVKIGSNTYIEPGCLIGHDVIIGDNAVILSGVVIKKSVIGNNLIANEKAVIGAYGFTMTEDEKGDKFRIPTLGNVHIGNNVEIGAHDNISCGSSGDTVIDDYVKLDAFVYIGHDVHISKDVEIAAGGIIGGFTNIEPYAYVGLNATVRNRITLEKNSVIGMGANVIRRVDVNETVVGNPARVYRRAENSGTISDV